MRLLLETHLLLWAAGFVPAASPNAARYYETADLIDDLSNELFFSAASRWEITIKSGLDRDDFQVNPHSLRRGLLDNGYTNLPITSEYTVAAGGLPEHHKDPFDRILVAQANVEGITLLTSDPMVASYPGPIRKV